MRHFSQSSSWSLFSQCCRPRTSSSSHWPSLLSPTFQWLLLVSEQILILITTRLFMFHLGQLTIQRKSSTETPPTPNNTPITRTMSNVSNDDSWSNKTEEEVVKKDFMTKLTRLWNDQTSGRAWRRMNTWVSTRKNNDENSVLPFKEDCYCSPLVVVLRWCCLGQINETFFMHGSEVNKDWIAKKILLSHSVSPARTPTTIQFNSPIPAHLNISCIYGTLAQVDCLLVLVLCILVMYFLCIICIVKMSVQSCVIVLFNPSTSPQTSIHSWQSHLLMHVIYPTFRPVIPYDWHLYKIYDLVLRLIVHIACLYERKKWRPE